MKDKGTQTKCSLCKKQYKVFSDPEKHNDRLFCGECSERIQELTGCIISYSPATSVEMWSGAVMVVSFTGGKLVDNWIEWPGFNGSPGIPRHNQPFRPWAIIGKFPLKECTDDEVTGAVWYWMVERVELREAWDLTLGRLRKDKISLEEKIQKLGEGDEFGQVDDKTQRKLDACREDLAVVKRRIEVGEYRQLFCPQPGEDTELFRRLVRINKRIEELQTDGHYTEARGPEIKKLSHEAAEIIRERGDLQMGECKEALAVANAILGK